MGIKKQLRSWKAAPIPPGSAIIGPMTRNENYTRFCAGMKASIPIALGYFAVSAAYGMAAIIQGMTVTQATVASLITLTSAGQFAGTTLICAGASLTELVLTQIIINARYFLMAISLAQKTAPGTPLWQRMMMAYGITDENYAVAISQKGHVHFAWMMGLIVLPVLGWSAGTLLGGLASSTLPSDLVNCLGLAMYGMFIAIIVPASRHSRPVLYCVLLACALSCAFAWVPALQVFSGGYSIIIITIVVSALMAWLFPHREEDES